MKLAAADALAAVVGDELRPDHIVPSPSTGGWPGRGEYAEACRRAAASERPPGQGIHAG